MDTQSSPVPPTVMVSVSPEDVRKVATVLEYMVAAGRWNVPPSPQWIADAEQLARDMRASASDAEVAGEIAKALDKNGFRYARTPDL